MRLRAALGALVVALTGLAFVPTRANAQVLINEADFSGFGTGSTHHTDLLQAGVTGPQVLGTDVAFSGATVASKGTAKFKVGPNAAPGTVVSEVDTVVQPTLPNTTLNANLKGNKSYGRGSGLEVGIANNLPVAARQVILQAKVQASAAPSSDLLTAQVGPVPANPIAWAALLRGQAKANWLDDQCILGEPISMGLGYAADAQLANSGAAAPDGRMNTPVVAADAPNPERSTSRSITTTELVPQTAFDNRRLGPAFGLMTEVRETIAPTTLFRGSANQTTIEVLGEWVLRAVATGVGGSAGNWISYGPANVSPQTPVIRVINAQGVVTQQLTTQQIFGNEGRIVSQPGVFELAIGEDPRNIGGNATTQPTLSPNGTTAQAAVDVVRVSLLEQRNAMGQVTQGAADIRIGHMEAHATVPPGGILCRLPVKKTVDKPIVTAGEEFTYTISVTNPFADCELTSVMVVDVIETDPGVRYEILSTNPKADVQAANGSTWNDIGPIKPKQTKSVTVTIRVSAGSASGIFHNRAAATGKCLQATARGDAQVVVDLAGEVRLDAPQLEGILAATGGTHALATLGGGLALLALAGRRVARRVRA